MQRQLFRALGLAMILLWSHSSNASSWPSGLSFVGLKAGVWQLLVVPRGASTPQAIPLPLEPRTPAYSGNTSRVAYIGADGGLREFDLASGRERVLALPDRNHGYTQPAYGKGGEELLVVVLKEGASVDTDIVAIDRNKARRQPVVSQRSAQFDPAIGADGWLYYSNVLCTTDCGQIIQEIWRKDRVSGVARQLTLLNALSRQPVSSEDGGTLYFSSNRGGNFHIWSLDLVAGEYRQLSDGRVADTDPAVDARGNLYFIRRSPAGTRLMRRGDDGNLVEVALPEGITDLRDLEIDR